MRKTFSVLALIAFACDIPRDPLVHGNPIGNPEVAERNDDSLSIEYQKEPSERFDNAEVSRRSVEERDQSPSEPVGKWRSNGEALEPKWRDGDYIPLLPFSQYRSYTRDEIDDAEDFPETSRRPFKHRYSIDQPNRLRGNPDRRGVSSSNDYDETTYQNREDYSRESSTIDEEMIESAASNDGKRGRNIVNDSMNDREVTSKYHEAFQARPDEYEHEFNDEEYTRPRPRKRRPPQNYEFVLANEAFSNEENEESRNSSSRFPLSSPNGNEKLPVMTRSSNNERENAHELKSLLKMQQEEGSSLSEILQRRNLSLSDLLKGKADVINALKSRITDESDEYIEKMSKVMSDSLMKLAATVTPSWRSTTTENIITTTRKIATVSNTSDNSISKIVPYKISKNYDESSKLSSNDTNRIKEESKNVENIAMQAMDHDSFWRRITSTIPTIISTVITTSTPIMVNSMEYFLNDDGNAGSTSDRMAKFENLDEDEIMEFSDFMDFKKGKSPAKATSEGIVSQQPPQDIESTLSIEQILNPTERIESTRYHENDRDDGNAESNGDKKIIQDNNQSIPIGESASADDYNMFIETEYQNDAPIFEEDDEKQNKVKSNPSVSQTNAVANPIEKKQTVNSDDDIKKLYDKNHSTEYHQVTRSSMEKTRDRTSLSQNYQDGDSKRYEEIISEIEPEARAEIFELFASGSAGKRLERLLKSRNMSVEELIELRQRGSSKVHLSEVSRLKITKPQNNLQTLETSNTNNEDIIQFSSTGNSNEREGKKISENKDAKREKAEESMIQFIKQDIMNYLHDPFFDKDVENMSMSRLLDLVERDKNATKGTFSENNTLDEHSELENSRRMVQIVDLLTTFDSLPFVKNMQRQFDSSEIDTNEFESQLPIDNDNASVILIDEETKIIGTDNSSAGQFQTEYMKEIMKEEPNVIDIRTIYGEERKTLSQMKPSIIASGAILGVTIVVFLAIFIVCRIRQKQKYMYRNTFSRAVFQNPVMMARKLSNSSSLSTVMVNVVATSTTKRPERTEVQEAMEEFNGKSDMDNDSLDGNDSWETIPDYAK